MHKPLCTHAYRPVGDPFHKVTGQRTEKRKVFDHAKNKYVEKESKIDTKSPNLTQTLFCSKCATTTEITIKTGRQ